MNHDHITQGRPENTYLMSSGPLEAFAGLYSIKEQKLCMTHWGRLEETEGI